MGYPVSPKEFAEARNRGYSCRHKFTGLTLTEEVSNPSEKDLLRKKQTYWCEACGGIKYAIRQGDGQLRSWKNA